MSGAKVAPQITSSPLTSATVGVAYAYRVTATDANGDTLSYSLTQAPAGMTINATSGQIAWTPTSTQTGNQAVTARVADPGGLATTQSFTVAVSVANVSPQIGNSWRIMPIGDSNTENLATFPGYQTITQALSAIGKSAAVFGYVIAQIAIEHERMLLHNDADFDLIATVRPLKHERIDVKAAQPAAAAKRKAP